MENSDMKKIFLIIPVTFLFLILTSCSDYLEKPPGAEKNLEAVFSTFKEAESVINAAYFLLPSGFPNVNVAQNPHAGLYGNSIGQFSDECEGTNAGRANNFISGLVAMPTEDFPFLEDKWGYNWSAIRSAYLYIQNADRIPPVSESERVLIQRRKSEALGIVGIKYFEMFKRYGGLPWMDKAYNSDEKPYLGRLSVEQTVVKIADVLDNAATGVPERWEDPKDYGRITKIGLKAIKARLLLYAASPLFNTNDPIVPFGRKELICAPYDRERWKKAADACKDVIVMAEANGYGLINTGNPKEDYDNACHLLDATLNTEVLQANRSVAKMSTSIYQNLKIYSFKAYVGQQGANNWGRQPTHNFVQLYEMVDPNAPKWNGEPYPPATGLDPRFYATIIRQGDDWAGRFKCDFSFDSKNKDLAIGNNNPNGRKAPTFCTGYGVWKFAFPEMERKGSLNVHIFWPYVRLSEIYLSYAEALNEYNKGPGGNDSEAYKYLKLVRDRAGMSTPSGMDYEEMKALLVNERAVELAFEYHRFWDLKRWGRIDILRSQNWGIKILKDAKTNAIQGYETYPTSNHTFPDKLWFWAFPNADVLKAAPDMIQNPGW